MAQSLVRHPIYQQLNEALRVLLRREYRAGDQFLTERQVCKQFEVSRATANKALSNLVAEGLLKFKKGVGTFVRDGVIDYDLRRLVSFTQRVTDLGHKPSTRILAFENVPASDVDPPVREALGISGDTPLLYIERLRLVDRKPVILERRHVVARHCPGLKRSDLKQSLYSLWTDRYDLNITGADQTIQAVNLTGSEADVLGVAARSASLMVVGVGAIDHDDPLWYERTLYRADAYAFFNRLEGVRTPRPAVGRLLEPAP